MSQVTAKSGKAVENIHRLNIWCQQSIGKGEPTRAGEEAEVRVWSPEEVTAADVTPRKYWQRISVANPVISVGQTD